MHWLSFTFSLCLVAAWTWHLCWPRCCCSRSCYRYYIN